MLVLVPLPFLFVSVLVVPGVVMGWWWLEERGGEVVVVGGAKVFVVFVPWWSCFMGKKGLVFSFLFWLALLIGFGLRCLLCWFIVSRDGVDFPWGRRSCFFHGVGVVTR
ncbi:hypothetical protein QL285_032960 [Trifolium repens]|nr:hypothetical protein QL285_032960 [Trifolium repens]